MTRLAGRWRAPAALWASRPKGPASYAKAFSQALKAEGPAIVDCVVAAHELPNLPHFELETIGNFAKAKIKEAILEVTGESRPINPIWSNRK